MKITSTITLFLLLAGSLKAQFKNEELAHLKVDNRLKQETIYTYPAKNGILTGDSTIHSSKRYSEDGYLIEEIEFPADKKSQLRYVYHYEKGKLSLIEIFDNNNVLKEIVAYTFNSKGLLSRRIRKTPQGYALEKDIWRYSKPKNRIKIIQEVNRDYMVKEKRYYKDDKLVEIKYYNKEAENPVALQYTYDNLGNLVKTTHSAFNVSNVIEEKRYNEQNLCIEKLYAKYYRSLGIRLELKDNIVKYKYAYNPNKTVKEVTTEENEQLTELARYFYTYY